MREQDLQTLADRAIQNRLMVAVAETVTSGALARMLGGGPRASEWFAGGVIARNERVNFELLGLEAMPICTPKCAVQMAERIARMTGVTLSVGVTGVAGPDAERGVAPGTMFVAVRSSHGSEVREVRPTTAGDAVDLAVDLAVELLAEYARHPIRLPKSA